MLSMTTDYKTSTGCPEPALRRIAEAGFTHVHWCHHWSSDFLYSDADIARIERWLSELGLGVTDLHGSAGRDKEWMSLEEHRRLAGVELVENRIRMAAHLGTDVVIMHLPELGDPGAEAHRWDAARRTLDRLAPCAGQCGVRIAVENGNYDDIGRLLEAYPQDYLGMCYDSGHGNIDGVGLDRMEAGLKDRLVSIHINGNDGTKDLHWIIGYGTVDCERLARMVAQSAYEKWVNLECTIDNMEIEDEREFLARAHEAGTTFAERVAYFARRGADAHAEQPETGKTSQ